MSHVAAIVWNRACYGGGEAPRVGDRHLAALLRFHGAAMNGGVLHAVQFCKGKELVAAKHGYNYLGLQGVVSLIGKAESVLRLESSPGDFERELDAEYSQLANDAHLSSTFNKRYAEAPSEFAPVQ